MLIVDEHVGLVVEFKQAIGASLSSYAPKLKDLVMVTGTLATAQASDCSCSSTDHHRLDSLTFVCTQEHLPVFEVQAGLDVPEVHGSVLFSAMLIKHVEELDMEQWRSSRLHP